MPAYIQGVERSQRLLLPEAVEDYVSPNDHVRFLDAFVDGLDMAKLGFRERKEKNNGRPSYSPQSMTKLLLWGYLNRCRSSRELEKACYDRLGVIWFTGKITPDHSTIAEFRKTNAKNLTKLLKERKRELGEKAKQCEQSPTGSLCETDPEARPLTKGGKTAAK